MVYIKRILFDLPSLETLKGITEVIADPLLSGFHCIGFNVTKAPERNAACFADCNGNVGVAIGKFEDGSSAASALKGDFNPIA